VTELRVPAAVVREASPRANPFVGLVPFDEDDVPWFFGRDREQRIIGANLRSSRLTLLYGASGVGKSSVLLAAVVPALRAVVAEDRVARAQDRSGLREPVRFAVSTFSAWRDAPLHGLTTAVAASVEAATGEAVQPWTPGTSLHETFAGWLGPVRNLLIVLDQFEEYFLYHPHDDGPGTFAGEFVDIVNAADLRVNVLVSLREDGLAKLDRFKGRIPRLFDNYLRVGHLDLSAARRAIEGPIEEYNRRLPAGAAPATIDEELIATILTEVRTREVALEGPGGPAPEAPEAAVDASGHVETPLLQLVMQRLWTAAEDGGAAPHLRLATLREQLGGIERIVLRHLEEALDGLSDAHRALAPAVLRPLVSPSGTKIAWRAEEIAYWAKRPTEEIEPILQELAGGEQRILRAVIPPPGQGDASARYEIFHDILAQPILEWCDAREAERERERISTELAEQERERLEAAHQQRRERRSRVVRRVAVGLAALTAGLIVAVYVAFKNNEIAGSRGLAASAMAQLPVDPERSVLLATQAVQRHDTDEATQALRQSLSASRVRATLGSGRPRPCRACGALAGSASGGAGTVDHLLAVAPDGRTVAAVVGVRLRLWRPQTGATYRPGVDVGEVRGVAFTPDARRLLVIGLQRAALMAPDGTRAVPLDGDYGGGATSADGRRVVTVGRGAAVWDARSGKRLARLGRGTYSTATFGRRGQIVLQDYASGGLVDWHWRTGRRERLASADLPGRDFSSRYSTGAAFAVDGIGGGKVRVVGAGGRTSRLPTGSAANPVGSVAISPDGSRIATARGAVVELWRSDRPWSGRPQRVAELVHPDGVNAVVFSPDGALVGTASTDGTARVWESSTGELVAELRGHAATVSGLAFSSRGRFVATVAEDLTIRLWDLGAERTLRGTKAIESIVPARSGTRVAVVEDGGALRIWDTRRTHASILHPSVPRNAMAFSEAPTRTDRAGAQVSGSGLALHPTSAALAGDGHSLLVGYATPDGRAGRAVVVDTRSGLIRATIRRSGPVREVAIAPDARMAAIVRATPNGNRVELWQLRGVAGARRYWRLPPPDEERPTDVAFSPDGRRLLVTTLYGGAYIFGVRSRGLAWALEGARRSFANPGPEPFYRGVFSPDGRTIAVAGGRDVRLWDSRSGSERPFRLTGHTSVLRAIAYSAGGRRIVTASADGTTRVWDARNGTVLAVLSRHAGRVNSAAFLPSGSIVSGGEDRAVRVYRCETCGQVDSLLDLARTHVTRDLSARERAEFVK
jgi:WD40 repeat protein